jgi:hypothetical protein
MNKTSIISALVLSSMTLVGCPHEPPLLEVYPLPDEVGDIDVSYIPLEYADTGHSYSMPLVAMELAVHGVPSAGVVIEDCDNEPGLHAPNGDKWGYHHAVGIAVDGEQRVVDPVLSPDLLTIDEFKNSFGDAKRRVRVGGDPFSGAVHECKDETSEEIPARVEDMAHFDFANVMIHCAYMRKAYKHIGGDYAAREAKLIKRVREMSLALDELGILDTFGSEEDFELVKTKAYCPPAIPDK